MLFLVSIDHDISLAYYTVVFAPPPRKSIKFVFFLLLVSLFFCPTHSFAADGAAASGSSSAAASPNSSSGTAASTTSSAGNSSITTTGNGFADAQNIQAQHVGGGAHSPQNAPKGSFQTYVEKASGKGLDLFGKKLFETGSSTFTPLTAVQVNLDYTIGPGDVLQIRGWGMIEVQLNATVDRSGEIYIPKVGTVPVAGVRYRDLNGYLKKVISKQFRNFELASTIIQTRSVQIYVVGHAARPGTYTMNAMSTLLNALFASGGPSATGSMRTIQLKRGTAPPVLFDLYDMLLYGDKSMDRSLQDGDVIYIPEVGPLVALLGHVKEPAIFELRKPTSLAELVGWAGGIESAAELKRVIVTKNVENRYTRVAEFQGDKAAIQKELSGLLLKPADIIRLFVPGAIPLEAQSESSFVTLSGAVTSPGVFEITKGETIRELVARIGVSEDNSYVFGTRLTRESIRQEQQKALDQAADRYEKEIKEPLHK